MNLNFTFGYFSRRTLLTVIRGIAPMELGIKHLEHYVLTHIEQQIRYFPFWHRVGLVIGLQFLEWGAILGGWGLIPLSWISTTDVSHRLHHMAHSKWPPIRLLIQGLKVLICLSAYGHPHVEKALGFTRRTWREKRILVQKNLLQQTLSQVSSVKESQQDPSQQDPSQQVAVLQLDYPTPPQALAHSDWLSADQYLDDDALQLLKHNVSQDLKSSHSS